MRYSNTDDVLKWAPLSHYCHQTSFENVSQNRGSFVFFCRLEHEVLFSGWAASDYVQNCLDLYKHSVCLSY